MMMTKHDRISKQAHHLASPKHQYILILTVEKEYI